MNAILAPSMTDWRPEGCDERPFIWSVAAVTNRGELLYHRVSAATHQQAVAAAMRELSDAARIVGASPVSL